MFSFQAETAWRRRARVFTLTTEAAGLVARVILTFFFLSPSSVFLAEQFESLQSHLDAMMPAAKKPFLQQFYSQASFIHVPLQPFCVTLQLTPMSKGVGPSLRFLPRVVITRQRSRP